MCDQTIPYTPGTWVWAKLVNRIWWPGKIVEVSSVPDELEYYKKKNKNAKTAVYFERDKSYELISNLDKVFLYSCSKKMEFIEKGYLLYHKQNKSGLVTGFDMTWFVDDVLNVEKDIGGDTDVFSSIIERTQNEENMKKPKININELFMSEKERKKREKIKKRSLSLTPKPIVKPPSSQLSISQMMPITPKNFICPFCPDFKANRYNILKIHMGVHKAENENNANERRSVNKKSNKKSPKTKKSASTSNAQGCSSTPKKRKNAKTKATDNKKIKLQEELLKDWDDEDLDETESIIQPKDDNTDNDSDQNNDTSVKVEVNQNNDVGKNAQKTEENIAIGIFDFDDNEGNELNSTPPSFSEQKNVYTSNEITEVIFGNKFNDVNKCSEDNVSSIISNDENDSGGEHPQIEDLTINVNKKICNFEENCSNINNEQLEEIEIQDKADAELEHNIENFLSVSSESNWNESLEKLNLSDGLDKANSFSGDLKMPTNHRNTRSELLKETPRAADQGVCSGDDLVGKIPSNKSSAETWRSEDHLQPDLLNSFEPYLK